jgi:hypothetical protein
MRRSRKRMEKINSDLKEISETLDKFEEFLTKIENLDGRKKQDT